MTPPASIAINSILKDRLMTTAAPSVAAKLSQMPLAIADDRVDTAHLSALQHGIYRLGRTGMGGLRQ